jgi:hypothetical protein
MTQSLSNLRQITIALHSYAADNGSSLPWARNYVTTPTPGNTTLFWAGWLTGGDYVSTAQVFRSPARSYIGQDTWANWEWQIYSGYGVNRAAMPERELSIVGEVPPALTGLRYYPTPIQFDKQGNPTDSQMIAMTEMACVRDPGVLVAKGSAGWFYAGPQRSNNTTSPTPYTYRGAAPTAYLDAHAAAPSSDRIGWNAVDAFNGSWRYTAVGSFRFRAPWFDLWYTQ